LGYTVECAEHGERAIALYQAARDRGTPFDGVILNLTVRGGMGGAQTLQVPRRVSPAVKAIASSGYADDPILLDPLRHGFLSALPKPLGFATLSEVVAKVLGA
jgi:CheY-like chemotaxis protein